MFVKLGQVVSTRNDLVSPEFAAELSLLQDDVRPASRESVEALLDEELGRAVQRGVRLVRLASDRGGVDRAGVPRAAPRRITGRRQDPATTA